MKKKIVAVSHHPGSAQAIALVIKDLLGDDNLSITTLGYGNKSPGIFSQYGIPLTPLENFGTDSPNPISGFESPLPMKSVLEQINADFVLTAIDLQLPHYSIDQAAILASQKLCPSLSVTSLIADFASCFTDPHNGQLILPTRISVIDQIAKQNMSRQGFPLEKIVVTGNPYFDSLSDKTGEFDSEKREQMKRDRGLSGYYITSFFSGPIASDHGDKYGFDEKDSFRMFLDGLSQLSESDRRRIKVLFKTHPRENPDNLDKLVCSYPGLSLAKTEESVREVLLISDINTSPFSTALYESALIGKPALALQPGISLENQKKLYTYRFRRYIPTLIDASSVSHQIYSFMHDAGYANKIAKGLKSLENDGKAGERVKKLVYKMLG